MPICAFQIHETTITPVSELTLPQVGYLWAHFDLEDPGLPAFLEQYVPEIPAAALVAPETRPRSDRYGAGMMLNLRGVNMNADGPADQMVSVRMWATAQLMVTVRVRKVVALDAMRQEAETGIAPESPMHFVATLAARLMGRAQDTVFDLGAQVDTIEDMSEDDAQSLVLTDLIDKRRMGIRMRRYLAPQRDALVALGATDSPLMTQGVRDQLREQANLAKLAVEELEGLIARMTAVQEHYAAQAAAAQGHNAYVLSVVAAVFLPLGFLTGLFGVNVAGMPGVETSWAFWALCAGLVALTVVALWILRRLRWI